MYNSQKIINLQSQINLTKTSDRYKLIDTIETVQNLGLNLDDAKLKTFKDSTLHSLTWTFDGELKVGDDVVKPTLMLVNSFNGQGALKIMIGAFRVVCSNGLVVGPKVWSASAKHIEGPKMNTIISDIKENIVPMVAGDWSQLLKPLQTLVDKKINRTQAEWICDEMKLGYTAYNASLRAFEKPVREADVGDSAWLAYNRIQEVVAHSSRGQSGFKDNMKLMDLVLTARYRLTLVLYPLLRERVFLWQIRFWLKFFSFLTQFVFFIKESFRRWNVMN